jgi:hypothetical protein
VLVSTLGLTVIAKHLVKLVKQVLQPALKGRKKQLKGREHMVFSVFVPYCSKSLQMFSAFS